jgi:DeoR/GlpR family transcriptional regulator of sugar metabolism
MAMLSTKYACSESTIRRRVREMEESGMFPLAIRRVCGVMVDDEMFERFCCLRRREK